MMNIDDVKKAAKKSEKKSGDVDPSENDGVCFSTILSYVRGRLRMGESAAMLEVRRVLEIGIRTGKIVRTKSGNYCLAVDKPPGLACKIKEQGLEYNSEASESSDGSLML